VGKSKSEAQKFLEKDEMLAVRIECLLAEKEQWADIARKITASMGEEKVQSSGSQSKMADAAAACVDAEGEILQAVQKFAAERKRITAVLGRLDNATWYKLLHLRYIQRYSLSEVADIFNASYDWAKTTHGRALGAVQAILDRKDIKLIEK
jgi:DNA-directed RNA polymerase specialized sigma24 family protein